MRPMWNQRRGALTTVSFRVRRDKKDACWSDEVENLCNNNLGEAVLVGVRNRQQNNTFQDKAPSVRRRGQYRATKGMRKTTRNSLWSCDITFPFPTPDTHTGKMLRKRACCNEESFVNGKAFLGALRVAVFETCNKNGTRIPVKATMPRWSCSASTWIVWLLTNAVGLRRMVKSMIRSIWSKFNASWMWCQIEAVGWVSPEFMPCLLSVQKHWLFPFCQML